MTRHWVRCAIVCCVLPVAATFAEGGGDLAFRQAPCVRFLSPTSAELTWEARQAGKATVRFGPFPHPSSSLAIEKLSSRKRVVLDGLEPRTRYAYQIDVVVEGAERRSVVYELDTTCNYSAPAAHESGAVSDDEKEHVSRILAGTDSRKGYCLLLGPDLADLALELIRRTELRVAIVSSSREAVARDRRRLYESDVYGTRVTARFVDDSAPLPFTRHFASLAISFGGAESRRTELARLLRPGGVLASTDHAALKWRFRRASELDGVGEWTSQYGTLANTASCGETLGGARATTGLAVQWIGLPGGDFGLDRNPRMPAPLSANGRLFHQGMNRVIALDVYSGAVLWGLEIPALRRVNIPRDCGNWRVDGDTLQVVVKDQLWLIDAETGVIERVLHPPTDGARSFDWGYIGGVDDLIVGSVVAKGGAYTDYWGKAAWYDKPVVASTAMVCGNALFAMKPDGDVAWTYSDGKIVQPTISIDRSTITFVESQSGDATATQVGRLGGETLWGDTRLVCLDARSGDVKWARSIVVDPDSVVVFGASCEQGVVITHSANKKYHVRLYDHESGALKWEVSHNWTSDNHSGHMQHPVIMGGNLYLEPHGYRLADGKQLAMRMAKREGCHTYLAAKGALIHRGEGRLLAMWDPVTGQSTSWPHLRPSCWLSAIPSGGMLLAPEGGGGCSCGRWIEASIGFAPWGVDAKEVGR